MRVEDFLYSTDMTYTSIVLFVDEESYYENELENGMSYESRKDVPKAFLDAKVHFWDIEQVDGEYIILILMK